MWLMLWSSAQMTTSERKPWWRSLPPMVVAMQVLVDHSACWNNGCKFGNHDCTNIVMIVLFLITIVHPVIMIVTNLDWRKPQTRGGAMHGGGPTWHVEVSDGNDERNHSGKSTLIRNFSSEPIFHSEQATCSKWNVSFCWSRRCHSEQATCSKWNVSFCWSRRWFLVCNHFVFFFIFRWWTSNLINTRNNSRTKCPRWTTGFSRAGVACPANRCARPTLVDPAWLVGPNNTCCLGMHLGACPDNGSHVPNNRGWWCRSASRPLGCHHSSSPGAVAWLLTPCLLNMKPPSAHGFVVPLTSHQHHTFWQAHKSEHGGDTSCSTQGVCEEIES